ncbi:MAG: type I-C CRISPR-associated protein Cas7/Csd2, partial [Planctomycetota bacterium]
KQQGDNRTMGRKFTIPYGLYRAHIYVSPHLADPARNGTGFSEEDLAIIREALNNMFDHDRSAARGQMSPVKCWAFKHDNALGNARADQLFKRISVQPVDDVAAGNRPARSAKDFVFHVDNSDLPKGVTIEEWI